MSNELELTAREVRTRLDDGEPLFLLDCREPEEFAVARMEGAELIPMGTVPNEIQRIEAIADERAIVVICHHGVRSLQVAAWLRRHGLENSFSLAGGIDRWSLEIDGSVPRY